jgi:hypothetical protein
MDVGASKSRVPDVGGRCDDLQRMIATRETVNSHHNLANSSAEVAQQNSACPRRNRFGRNRGWSIGVKTRVAFLFYCFCWKGSAAISATYRARTRAGLPLRAV